MVHRCLVEEHHFILVSLLLKSLIFIFISVFVVCLSSPDIFHCHFCFSLNKENYVSMLLLLILLSPVC